MTLSLNEVSRLLDTIEDPFEAMDNEQVQEFISAVDTAGTDILNPKDDQYLTDAVDFLLANSLVTLLMTDSGMEIFLYLCAHQSAFRVLMASALKASVGLAALEELR